LCQKEKILDMDLLCRYIATDTLTEESLDPGIIQRIHAELNTSWGCAASIRHSMAPRCVQLSRANMSLLQTMPYTAAEKTHGERMLMLFTRLPYPAIIFVDRERRFLQVRGDAPAFFFNGNSLFDGELIEVDGCRIEYRIFDMARIGGEPFGFRNYLARMREVQRVLKLDGLKMPDPLTLLSKCPCLATDLPYLLTRMEDLNAAYDGIVFTPINRGISLGTDRHTLKYKLGRTTADLHLSADGQTLCTHLDGSALVECSTVAEISALGKMVLMKLDTGEVVPSSVDLPAIIEFAIIRRGSHKGAGFALKYEGERKEKRLPNHAKTVASVLVEVIEGITLQEIVKVVQAPYAHRAQEHSRAGMEEAKEEADREEHGSIELQGGSATRARKKLKRKQAEEEEEEEEKEKEKDSNQDSVISTYQ
jgi:hypothetical protein